MVFIIISALSMLIYLILLMILLSGNRIATILTVTVKEIMLSTIQSLHSHHFIVICNMSVLA